MVESHIGVDLKPSEMIQLADDIDAGYVDLIIVEGNGDLA
jgi:hypothetical protein